MLPFEKALISIAPISMRKSITGLAVREDWKACGMGKGNRWEVAVLEVLTSKKHERILTDE